MASADPRKSLRLTQIEEIETDAHRAPLKSDLGRLVDKYRAIFGRNVPETDEALSQRLIIESQHRARVGLRQPVAPTHA